MEEHLQKTLVIIKPDAVQRTLVGEIIRRFEQVGLKIIAMKMIHADSDLIEKHYSLDPEWKKKAGEKALRKKGGRGEGMDEEEAVEIGSRLLNSLKNFMTAGPVVVIVLEGVHAVQLTRKLVGGTEPFSSDVGTIRGDFVLDSYTLADSSNRAIRNAVHASSSDEEAEKEVALWFEPGELLVYKTAHEHIMYDVNFDNVTE